MRKQWGSWIKFSSIHIPTCTEHMTTHLFTAQPLTVLVEIWNQAFKCLAYSLTLTITQQELPLEQRLPAGILWLHNYSYLLYISLKTSPVSVWVMVMLKYSAVHDARSVPVFMYYIWSFPKCMKCCSCLTLTIQSCSWHALILFGVLQDHPLLTHCIGHLLHNKVESHTHHKDHHLTFYNYYCLKTQRGCFLFLFTLLQTNRFVVL